MRQLVDELTTGGLWRALRDEHTAWAKAHAVSSHAAALHPVVLPSMAAAAAPLHHGPIRGLMTRPSMLVRALHAHSKLPAPQERGDAAPHACFEFPWHRTAYLRIFGKDTALRAPRGEWPMVRQAYTPTALTTHGRSARAVPGLHLASLLVFLPPLTRILTPLTSDFGAPVATPVAPNGGLL